MKKYVIFVVAMLATSLVATAQRQGVPVQQTQQNTILQKADPQIMQAIAADLTPHAPVLITSNGKRYLKAFILNQGKIASQSCYLKVTYKWKTDYEQFTLKELVKAYTIKPLNPNEIATIVFEVPDDKIKSNPTFGSKYVSIRLEADATGLVFEQDEQNNVKQLSLPIIH